MESKEPCLDSQRVEGRDESLNFGLPTNIGVSDTFNNRLKDIFGGLQSLEQKHAETVATFADDDHKEPDDEDDVDSNDTNGTARTNGKRRNDKELSSCDLRRKLNENKRQGVPNYVSNPEKWKKYSLKEDGSLPMSSGRTADEMNTAVAMDFMQKLKKRKSLNSSNDGESCDKGDDEENENDSHVFQVPALPSKHQKQQQADSDEMDTNTTLCKSTSNHSSKAWRMETFEFGQNNSKSSSVAKKKRVEGIGSDDSQGSGCVVLEHCCEKEEEDETNSSVDEINKDSSDSNVVCTTSEDSADGTSVSGPVVFNSRGRKKRAIRKREHVDDEEDGDCSGV